MSDATIVSTIVNLLDALGTPWKDLVKHFDKGSWLDIIMKERVGATDTPLVPFCVVRSSWHVETSPIETSPPLRR